MRPDVAEASRRLAMRKLADKYVGRNGEPPSLSSRRAAARAQDLNDDDRKHLRWCLDQLNKAAWGNATIKDARAALDFVTALLERDYNLYPERKL
jgi:hypothetical protein